MSIQTAKTASVPTLTCINGVTWEEALREFLLHKQATFAAKTVRYCRIRFAELVRWADAESISFETFGKRHMDRYTANRRPPPAAADRPLR